MNKEQERYLRQAWTYFRTEHDRSPDMLEWINWVEESLGPGNPLEELSPTVREGIIRKAFDDFEGGAMDSRQSEQQQKWRDAETNLHSRRYVDGTF